MTARPAQDRFLTELGPWPDGGWMIGDLGVAIETRKPTAAALELNSDNIERGVPVCATGPAINVDPKYLTAVNNSHE